MFVTRDPSLAAALKTAAPATPVLTAASPAQLADVLLSRACGAMLIDVGPLGRGASTVIAHLNRQFPDVPVVAVGAAGDEAGVAPLIHAGAVFEFLVQPFAAARTQAAIEAALKRHRELRPAAGALAARANGAAGAEDAPLRPVRAAAAAAQAPAPAPLEAVAQPTTPAARAPGAPGAPGATVATAAGSSPAPMTTSPEPAARPVDPAPSAPSSRSSPAPAGTDAPRPPRAEKPAGESGGSGRGEGGRKGGKDAPPPAPLPTATGPAPRTIAIGGSGIAVLAVVAWVLLKHDPLPEPERGAAVPVVPAAVTASGLHPILRPADSEPAAPTAEAAADADSAAARQRADRPREVGPRPDPPPPPPVPVKKLVDTLAIYPPAARAAGTEGWADVKFTINLRGMPEDVRVSAARPRGVFEPAAIEAVRSWRYATPPAPVEVTVRVRFAPH